MHCLLEISQRFLLCALCYNNLHFCKFYCCMFCMFNVELLFIIDWFPGWHHFNNSISRHARQPSDDGYSDEDCVEIRRVFAYPGKGAGQTSSFFWNDRNCEERNPFLCQYDKHISKSKCVQHTSMIIFQL
jgi:hypothetical protein